MNAAQHLESYLESLARDAAPGERLPTVRQLMAEFGVSQALVQRATERLKAEGRITAEAGRGMFFVGESPAARPGTTPRPRSRTEQRSVLFLRRSTSLQRGRRVLDLLQDQLQVQACRVVQLSYTDTADALKILGSLPRFNACVLQSTFETISIDMLAAARRKSDAIVVDGAALAGTEADAVGVEWGSAIDTAFAHLRAQGHEQVGLVIGSHFLLATELGRLWFEARTSREGTVLAIPAWPQEDYGRMAVERLAQCRDPAGHWPFSALIVWGIERGAEFMDLLKKQGIAIPGDLSVVLLGRTDLENEHADFFAVCGPSTRSQAEALHQAIERRWFNPDCEYRVQFLQMTLREGHSVAPPRSV